MNFKNLLIGQVFEVWHAFEEHYFAGNDFLIIRKWKKCNLDIYEFELFAFPKITLLSIINLFI